MIVSGTGKHEFYQNLQSFISGMEKDQQEARDIFLEILDEWYSAQEITHDCALCMAPCGSAKNQTLQRLSKRKWIRFTMVLQNMEDKICIRHIHQSIPYVEQAPGEYYPKTILVLANEAIERARHLERGMVRKRRGHMDVWETGIESRWNHGRGRPLLNPPVKNVCGTWLPHGFYGILPVGHRTARLSSP